MFFVLHLVNYLFLFLLQLYLFSVLTFVMDVFFDRWDCFSYLLYDLDGSYIFVIHNCFFIVLLHVLAHCVLFLFYTLCLLLVFLVCFPFSSLILRMFLIIRFCCLCFLFLILDPFSLLLFLLFALDVVLWSLFVSLFYLLCSGVLSACSLSLFLCLDLFLFLFCVCWCLFVVVDLVFLLSSWLLFWCFAISSYYLFAIIVLIPCVCSCSLFFILLIICFCFYCNCICSRYWPLLWMCSLIVEIVSLICYMILMVLTFLWFIIVSSLCCFTCLLIVFCFCSIRYVCS